MTKKIIVFGNGQLGNYVKNNLKIDGYDVSLLTDDITSNKPSDQFDYTVSYIINTAAKTNLDWCELNPEKAMKINYFGAENISNLAKSLGAHLIHISTDQARQPINTYARTKRLAEKAIRKTNFNSSILRVSWLYGGTRDEDKNFVKTVAKKLLSGEPLYPGEERGFPTHCENVVKFLENIIIKNNKYYAYETIEKPFDCCNSNTYKLRDNDIRVSISKKQFIEKIASEIETAPKFSTSEQLVKGYIAQRPGEDKELSFCRTPIGDKFFEYCQFLNRTLNV